METHYFWAFFIIALIAGASIALVISNNAMTGYFSFSNPFGTVITPTTTPTIIPTACTDSDRGNNIYVKGTCIDSAGAAHTDACNPASKSPLSEWYCLNSSSGYKCDVENTYCPTGYICREGACINLSNSLIVGSESSCNSQLDCIKGCLQEKGSISSYNGFMNDCINNIYNGINSSGNAVACLELWNKITIRTT